MVDLRPESEWDEGRTLIPISEEETALPLAPRQNRAPPTTGVREGKRPAKVKRADLHAELASWGIADRPRSKADCLRLLEELEEQSDQDGQEEREREVRLRDLEAERARKAVVE